MMHRTYGLSEDLTNWIKGFLACRKQRVVLGDNKSEWVEVVLIGCLEKTKREKDLGVTFTPDLNWKDQILEITTRANIINSRLVNLLFIY